ncbi:hypothetical protein BGZ76_007119, partial [Entomortierella beljakovae]
HASQQFPSTKLNDKDGEPIDWESRSNIIVNGKSAPWGDAFIVRESAGRNILILHQDKFDYNSDLLSEHEKNMNNSKKAEKNLGETLASYRHITIVFTTQPFDGNDVAKDCLVISKDNFKDYFGPVFASRATFALTRAINPNFSELSRMRTCLSGVGDVTAGEIIKKRPYLSQEDFCEKMPRVKNSIMKYEKENPGKKIKLDFFPFQL